MNYEVSLASSRSETRGLIESWSHTPAVLIDRHLEVLSSNSLARALSESFYEGTNLARFAFLDENVTRTRDCWDETAAQLAAMLRDSLDQHESDGEFLSIVGELSTTSWDFSDAWADGRRADAAGVATFLGTVAGEISLGYHLTRLPDNFDDTLLLFGPIDERSTAAIEVLATALAPRADRER